MSYIHKTTHEIVNSLELRQLFPNTSFANRGWTDEDLEPFGFAELHRPVDHDQPGPNEKLVDGDPYEENGKWYLPFIVVQKTPEEIQLEIDVWRTTARCTPFQGKAALYNAGLLDDVEALIASSSTNGLTKLAWGNATEWQRMSPMIANLAAALGLSDVEVDDLFKAAQLIG